MRRYVTFFIIAVMTLGVVFLLVTRARTPHDAPAEVVVVPETKDAAADARADAAADAALEAATPLKATERPLRVAALGWELAIAAAALVTPDGGISPHLEIAPEATLDGIEARLARGGTDPVGADVAFMPLPAFVVAYDRLRALEPRAFVVVGFSRGREEIHAAAGALLKAPPGSDEVKLLALGPSTANDPAARAAGSESATALGLFALDLLGVAPARVHLVAPGAPDAKTAAFAALTRGAGDDRKVAFSTADASRLVPIVGIAPRAVLEGQEAKIRELAIAWFDGLERAGKDASSVARRLASKELLPLAAGVGGAPEAIALLERLGQIENVSLAKQGTLLGPGAKGPVSLEALMRHTWQLARAGGLTTNAAPDPLPIDARVVVAIAPAPPSSPRAETPADGDAGAFASFPVKSTPLIVYRAVDSSSDAASVAAEIAFLAGVFERAGFRVTAKGGEKAARAIAALARDREGVAAARLATAPGEPVGAFASVEVVALP